MSNCLNLGSITTTGTWYCYTAGIVANNVGPSARVISCLNLGRVSGTGGGGCKVNTIVCATDNNGANAQNCYSLEGLGALGKAENSLTVTPEQLASGYTAWMLNGQAPGVWKQNIGTDAYPGFSGDNVYLQSDGSFSSVCDHLSSTAKPTCTQSAVCSVCGETIPAFGHGWDEVLYKWADDGSACTASRVCKRDASHLETAAANITAAVTKAPTCMAGGETTYTASFDVDWARGGTKTLGDVEMTGHRLVKKEAAAATHTSTGNIAYWYCTACQKYFLDDRGVQEISLADTVISKLPGHTPDLSRWESDETYHWNPCPCGEKLNRAEHTFRWIIDKEASGAAGSKHQECTVCGYKRAAVEIPAAGRPSKPADSALPDTGDNSRIGLWFALLLASAAGILVLAALRKKHRPKK